MCRYLYNYEFLYPVGGGREEVSPMTLEAINIERLSNRNIVGGKQWRFQVVGRGDQWFKTSYNWTLVEASPENLAQFEKLEQLRLRIQELQQEANKAFQQIKTWVSINEITDSDQDLERSESREDSE
jgi:hypothetical protein